MYILFINERVRGLTLFLFLRIFFVWSDRKEGRRVTQESFLFFENDPDLAVHLEFHLTQKGVRSGVLVNIAYSDIDQYGNQLDALDVALRYHETDRIVFVYTTRPVFPEVLERDQRYAALRQNPRVQFVKLSGTTRDFEQRLRTALTPSSSERQAQIAMLKRMMGGDA